MEEDDLPRSALVLAHVLNDQYPQPTQSLPMASTSATVVSPDNTLPPLTATSAATSVSAGTINSSAEASSSSRSSSMHRGEAERAINVDLDHELDHDTDSSSSSSTSLKRLASNEFENGVTAKRKREDGDECLDNGDEDEDMDLSGSGSDGEQARLKAKAKDDGGIDGEALAEHLAQELQCPCCSELVYKPVIVTPCQHFFCGSCCTLWIKNGGTNCPACRGVSTVVTPSRALQAMVDVLLRAAPHKERTERERQQADEVYPQLRTLRFPEPREPSPEPAIPTSNEFVRPCPHCLPGNPYGWHCPTPIVDPNADAEGAWHVDDGAPPGHGFCGNCEVVLALQAPTTTKCDFCQVSFCGINVQTRCIALPLMQQHPHGLADIEDLIQSSDVYECFDGNTVEVEYMLDYLRAQSLTPRHVYREIVTHILTLPNTFRPLLDLDLFSDLYPIPGGPDPNPAAPRQRICRLCAAEVLLYGFRDWWVRERRKGFVDPESEMAKRKDCVEGRSCPRQGDLEHANEFNHIIIPPLPDNLVDPSRAAAAEGSQAERDGSSTGDTLPTQTHSQTQIQPQDLPLPHSPVRILPVPPPQIPLPIPLSDGEREAHPFVNIPSLRMSANEGGHGWFGANVEIEGGVENVRMGLGGEGGQRAFEQQQQLSFPHPLVLRHYRGPGGGIALPSFSSLFSRFGEGESGHVVGSGSEEEESFERFTGQSNPMPSESSGHGQVMMNVNPSVGNITSTDHDSEPEPPADTPLERSLELDRESFALASGHRRIPSNVSARSATDDDGNISSSQISVHEVELALQASSEGDPPSQGYYRHHHHHHHHHHSLGTGSIGRLSDSYANDLTAVEASRPPKSEFLTREEIGTMLAGSSTNHTSLGGLMSGSEVPPAPAKFSFESMSSVNLDAMVTGSMLEDHQLRIRNASRRD